MRQTKLLLATIAMLWCSLTASAHDFEVDGVYYNITSETDLTVEVTYRGNSYDEYSNEYSGTITIPSVVYYYGKTYSVTEIGFAAFAYCSNLTVLNTPESITGIGSAAFFLCSSLRSINIPKGVMTIESQTFCGCSSLISITIPEGVTIIGYEAFYGCTSLTSITIPEGVTGIGQRAFSYCTSLTSITIPENSQLTIIGYEAFRDCSSLTSITIPESVTSIGGYAFHGTAWYDNQPDGVIYIDKVLYTYKGTMPANTSIEVKEGTEYIANRAFYGCSSLTAINIPESVTSIEDDAFSGCTSLTAIIVEEGNTTYDSRDNCNAIIETSSNCLIVGCSATIIPESVTSIGNYAFSGCSSLTSITIPESVTSIGPYAFYGTAWYDNQPDGVIYINKVLYTYKGTMPANTSIEVKEGTEYIANQAFSGCSSLTAITIPESVTSIGEYAFSGCSSLTSVTIPESVTSIGDGAFRGCSSLTTITIPGSVTSIGSSAFYRCYSLTAITIPESVTEIGDYAFYDCSSLTSITIPEGVKSIGNDAFYNCIRLYTVINCSNLGISKGSTAYGYVAYYAEEVVNVNGLNAAYQFYTSNGVHYLASYSGNDSDLVLPDSYNGENYRIADNAFRGCHSLTSITIPESVMGIGDYAFYGCNSLTAITIPENSQLTSIGDYAFDSCISLTTITIPESVKSIGYRAFHVCHGLTTITIPENSQLTSIGDYAFYGCSSLTAINIPKGVTSIREQAFSSCSSLASITIPESSQLTSIGEYAFYNCWSLTSITIPASVTSIGNKTFEGCTSLKELVIADGGETLSLGYNMYDYYGTGKGLFYDCSLETIFLGRNLSYSSGTRYGYSPFYGQKALTSVTIGESVTSIGMWAFSGCSSLTSITIPESVTSIGDGAFYGCSSLYKVINCSNLGISKGSRAYGYVAYYAEKVLNGSNLSTVGDYQFYTSNGVHYLANYSGNDSNLVLPDSYNGENYKIDDYAFSGCRNLTSITIPERVTSIGSYAFSGCSSLTSITIPASVTSIGKSAFNGCTSLKELVIADGSETLSLDYNSYNYNGVGEGLFYDCPLETIYLGRNLSYSSGSAGYSPFYKQEALTSVTIGDGVTSIGSSAFWDCTSLTSITIPEGVTSIGDYAFWSCYSLYKVINCSNLGISKGSTAYGYVAYYAKKVLNGSNLSTVGDYQFYTSNGVHYLANYSGNDLNLVLPDSYNGENYKIADYAFYGCSSLTAITIPEGVTSIGDGAFRGCSSLTSITIPEGVKSIGNRAFSSCRSLTSITIPESVTSIGNYAFNECTSLKELVIEDGNETLSLGYNYYYSSVTGEGLFYDCPLETIYWGRNLSYDNDYQHGYSPFYDQKVLTSVTIGESVTSIEEWAFRDCNSLTSIIVEGGNTTYDSRDNCNAIIETSGNCLIVGCSTTIIPEGVTSIGMYAFYNCSSLTSITIPERVTSIGSYAFYNCSSLTSITIPKSSQLTWIGNYAFYGCSSLTSITIPERVTSIGNFAFVLCTSLKELVIEDGSKTLSLGYNKYYDNVDYYGPGLFYDCPLKTIYLGRNLSYSSGKSYGYSPFYNKKALTSVTIGESVTSIEDYAFYNCSSLTAITIPESVTSIGLYAFSGTAWYDNQPDGVIYINKVLYTYKGTMPANTSIEVKEGTEYIANRAFYDCSSLTSITIPESVTSIGNYAFSGCSSLTAVHIKDITSWCNIDFDGYSANPLYYAKNLYLNGELVTELTIPNTVTAIKSYAFYNCSSLTAITIPESSQLTSIGGSAFDGCSSLTAITIPESSQLTSIGGSAFNGCSSLTAITIPESVASIESWAFNGCTSLKELVIADGSKTLSLGCNKYDDRYTGEGLFYDCPLETIFWGRNLSYDSRKKCGYSPFYNQKALTSVTIGESVTSIGTSVFYGCSSLTAVHIKDIASWCNISFGDSDSNPLYYAKNLYLNGELVTELTIPNTVTAIKDYVFSGCRNLSSITIPESVTSIGKSAFNGCTSLKELVIADGSETLSLGYNEYYYNGTGKGLFYDCPLETIYLGRNLSYDSSEKYGYSPFYNKKALTSVTIGESVTNIGSYAFYNCSSLTSITIPENSQLTSIGRGAFSYCSSLTSITIPESVTSIGKWAFSYCSSLTSITLSEGVTSIGDDSFIGCSNVENLVVKGSAMPHVPSDKLKKIVLYSPAPLQSKGFSSTVYQNCMLYVPQEGLARYQIVEPWAYFWNIIAFDTSDIAPAELPEDDSAPIIYDLRGQRVDVPTRGNIYIVNGRKVLY